MAYKLSLLLAPLSVGRGRKMKTTENVAVTLPALVAGCWFWLETAVVMSAACGTGSQLGKTRYVLFKTRGACLPIVCLSAACL